MKLNVKIVILFFKIRSIFYDIIKKLMEKKMTFYQVVILFKY